MLDASQKTRPRLIGVGTLVSLAQMVERTSEKGEVTDSTAVGGTTGT